MIEILFEDEYCIIVNKPNNVLVHHSYYARNITDDSLLQLLKKQFNKSFYPIHRLDRKTSGLLLLAKDKNYVSKFQDLFISKSIQKKYYALVRGFTNKKGIIDSRIKNAETASYKDALTLYNTLSSIELKIAVQPYSTARYSFVEFEPKTGRMHQLRKHANKIAHPIIGDHKYGNRHHNAMFVSNFKINNLFLHAHQLSFKHPITKKFIFINAKLPEFWTNFFSTVNWDISLINPPII